MKQLKPTRVFEVVDVKDELPKEDGMYCVLSKCNVDFPLESYDSLKFIKGSFQQISNWEHIYWLKETTDKYLLSKEELISLLNKREDYINSTTNIFEYQSNEEWLNKLTTK